MYVIKNNKQNLHNSIGTTVRIGLECMLEENIVPKGQYNNEENDA